MSIFDTGKTTGAVGGKNFSIDKGLRREAETLANTDTSLNIRKKQAEFLEYMDNRKYRDTSAKAGAAEDRTTIAAEDSTTESTIATNDLKTKTAEAAQTLVPGQTSLAVEKLHEGMNTIQNDRMASAYFGFQDGQAIGMDQKELYDDFMQQFFVTVGEDPQRKETALKWLQEQGIDPENYNEQTFNALSQVVSRGIHTAEFTRQRLLAEMTLSAKIAAARASAAAGDPTVYDRASKEELAANGKALLAARVGMEDLTGTYDDEIGEWTGDQGAFVTAFDRASIANAARMSNGTGVSVVPEEMEQVYLAVMKDLPGVLTSTGTLGKTHRSTGGDFSTLEFQVLMDHVTSSLIIDMNASPRGGVSPIQAYHNSRQTMLPRLKGIIDSRIPKDNSSTVSKAAPVETKPAVEPVPAQTVQSTDKTSSASGRNLDDITGDVKAYLKKPVKGAQGRRRY